MAVLLFKNKEFSSVYGKHMYPVSSEVMDLILSYIEEKKGKPYRLAVDVGCGTGRYTLPLAHHFHQVLGVDISESQLNEAKKYISETNVYYKLAPAEKLPLGDSSVDLVNAGLAAHWFNVDKFVHEAVRVLKPNGCLAVHAFYPDCEIEYRDSSEALTAIIMEAWETLFKYVDKTTELMLNQYEDIFKAVPLPDKQWITDIPVTFLMSVPDIIGFLQSVYMYQTFAEEDPIGAQQFLIMTEQRLRDILGADSDRAVMEVHVRHYCVLACKS
ncbi:putative methyltransferase isoform 2-T2 [Discoglossus pictus]